MSEIVPDNDSKTHCETANIDQYMIKLGPVHTTSLMGYEQILNNIKPFIINLHTFFCHKSTKKHLSIIEFFKHLVLKILVGQHEHTIRLLLKNIFT